VITFAYDNRKSVLCNKLQKKNMDE